MPPKRGAKAKAAAAAPPLTGCVVAISGTFPGTTQAAVGEQVIQLGGTVVKTVTPESTHLIATPAELRKQTAKVKAALKNWQSGCWIVDISWLHASADENARAPEKDHNLLASGSGASAANDPTNGNASPSQQQANGGHAKRSPSPIPASTPAAKKQKTVSVAQPKAALAVKTKIASQSKSVYIPQDEGVNAPTHQVYTSPEGVIYDASLNQTNSSNNNNKFYRLQVRAFLLHGHPQI
jgi:poly [ADP-ribose] polymerase